MVGDFNMRIVGLGVRLDWAYCCWKLKTENWKYCSKIIFKYVNSIVGSIFNILIREQCMNSAKQYMNSAKQCVNSKPMWGYCSRAEKKKKKKKNRQKTWTWKTRYANGTLDCFGFIGLSSNWLASVNYISYATCTFG